ncbi:MAG: hypothetical protein EHM79_02375 [Geobacter sp.]|nr:MAG: hypothetical protein EHM79_02375 [Geobacter sp.]
MTLLYQSEAIAIELKHPLYDFDSTTIDLCLSLFPWAEFLQNQCPRKAFLKFRDKPEATSFIFPAPKSAWFRPASRKMLVSA